MSVQYISDEKGKVTAVQLPIKEWQMIKAKYPDIDGINFSLPQWQKDLIDARLNEVEADPNHVRPISELLDELDS